METWLIAATPWIRALLGFVFLLAAASKLRDPAGFAGALGALGIERPASRASLKIGVPAAEAGLGIWLWTGWAPLSSATVTSIALVLLTAALVDLRRKGHKSSCGCFAGGESGVGSAAIVRNAILFALSLAAVIGAHAGASASGASPSWLRLSLLAGTAMAAALGVYGWLTRRRRVAVAAGADAGVPPIDSVDLAGRAVGLGRPAADAQLVVFARGRCPGCLRDRDLLNRLPLASASFETVIVCGGDPEATTVFAAEVRPPIRVVADPRWRTAVAWQVTTTPFTVVVARGGRLLAQGQLVSTLPLLMPEIEHELRGHESVA